MKLMVQKKEDIMKANIKNGGKKMMENVGNMANGIVKVTSDVSNKSMETIINLNYSYLFYISAERRTV